MATSAGRAHGGVLRAILLAGGVAGTFDILSAFLLFGRKVPLGIAGGVLGPSARSGGAGTWLLGLALHYVIAYGAATVFVLASRRLGFLTRHWLVCGPVYGILVWMTTNLIVLPLSAYHRMGPFTYWPTVQAIAVLMVVFGLPLAYLTHKLAPSSAD